MQELILTDANQELLRKILGDAVIPLEFVDAFAPDPKTPSANRPKSADAFAGDLTPREWRVKGLQLKDATLCVLYGDSTAGKSFFMQDVATCIHRGVEWNGRRVVRGRVVYLCAEGAGDFKYRLHAYARDKGIGLAELPPVIDNAPDLFDGKGYLDVIEQVQAAGGCDVLVIDTLSATFSGDENGSDMGRYVRNVMSIARALRCTVWAVHHTGKDASKGARGWSGLRASLDTEVELTNENGQRTARVTKVKGGPSNGVFLFTLKFVALGTDEDGEQYGSMVPDYVDTKAVDYKPTEAPLRKALRPAFDAVSELSPACEPVTIDAVIENACVRKGWAVADIKRYHRRDVREQLDELKTLGRVWIEGDECGKGSRPMPGADWLEA